MDVIRFGKHIITLIFTKGLGQDLDCSAAIDRVENRKDIDMVGKTLAFQYSGRNN